MMIRIPVVMTGEIESWPCEELMYCSRANVWQEWDFAAVARASHAAHLILCNNWLEKTKCCGKGHLKGACRSKVCLHRPWPWFFFNKLALSLSRREKERKGKCTQARKKKGNQCCFGSCPDSRHPNHVCDKQHWSYPRVVAPFSHLFVSSPTFLAKMSPEFWLKTKDGGRHLDPCAQAEVALSLGTGGISSMKGEHGSNDC